MAAGGRVVAEERPRLVVLTGNGLSMACSPDFGVQKLAEMLRARLLKDEDFGAAWLEAATQMAAYLEGVEGGHVAGFEALVGVFATLRRSVKLLELLSDTTDDNARQDALGSVSQLCELAYRVGTSHVLELIDQTARAANCGPLNDLVDWIERDFGGKTVFATLNYDTLLDGVLLERFKAAGEISDLASGLDPFTLTMRDEQRDLEWLLTTYRLRCQGDRYPLSKRVCLLHLHGSVQFWRIKTASGFLDLKVPIGYADRKDVLKGYRDRTQWDSDEIHQPLVILGHQRDKSVDAARAPFDAAYGLLGRAVSTADALLVIGYSFQDAVLNEALRDSIKGNTTLRSIMVSTLSKDLDKAYVSDLLNIDKSVSVLIDAIGVTQLDERDPWQEFVAQAWDDD